MAQAREENRAGRFANTGHGPSFAVLEIGDPERVAVVEADTAYWALVERSNLQEALAGTMVEEFAASSGRFREEMASCAAASSLRPFI
jgi:uncharacterized protein